MFFGGLKFAGSLLNIFGNKKCSRVFPTKFFVKSVARGNAVQIYPNFPAKRLSIYRKNCHTFN